MSKPNITRLDIENKIESGEGLTEEERQFRRDFLAEDAAKTKTQQQQYPEQRDGEGMMWNIDGKKHSGFTKIIIPLKHPVTKEVTRYECIALTYDKWESGAPIVSKNGNSGQRITIFQDSGKAYVPNGDSHVNDNNKVVHTPRPTEEPTGEQPPVTTEKGKKVAA